MMVIKVQMKQLRTDSTPGSKLVRQLCS